MSSLIPRKYYLEKIHPFMHKSLIKVLVGQRRVGKSYVLQQLIQEIQSTEPHAHIIYINKEDLQFSFIKTYEDLYQYIQEHKKSQQNNYIFIDEIQEIAQFELALRSLLLDASMDIYCTGSNVHLLSRDIAGYLSGRAIQINIYSLSYPEFLLFMKLEDTASSFDLYLKYGGLPYLHELPPDDGVIFEYLKNIYSTIAMRDVVNRFAIRNPLFLEQLTLFLASNIGSLFSAKKISDYLKSQQLTSSPTQVQTYVDYLVNAVLIHRSQRYDIEGRRFFDSGEKYYFEDLGIRHALIGYRPQDMGKVLENTVFHHLQIAGYQVSTGGLKTQEIDFVANRQNERIYVQVALSLQEEKTLEREFGNLLKIPDNYPKYVVTKEAFHGNTYQGIECIGVRDFIKDVLGL